jgi:hypothetical protein
MSEYLGQNVSRADVLNELLYFAFDELFWISEAPNRGDVDGVTLELAERARAACSRIERDDPDKEYTGP